MTQIRGHYLEVQTLADAQRDVPIALPPCRAKNLPLLLNVDGRGNDFFTIWDWAANACEEGGCHFCPVFEAFPLDGTADAVNFATMMLKNIIPIYGIAACWLAAYTALGAWPLQTVLDTLGALWNGPLLATPQLYATLLFTRDGKTDANGQPIDGPEKYPELQTAIDRMLASAQGPDVWPLPVLPLPTPIPPTPPIITKDNLICLLSARHSIS